MLRIRKDVYISAKPCPDCEDFQKRVSEVTSIDFDLILLSSKKPTSQQRAVESCGRVDAEIYCEEGLVADVRKV